MSSSITHEEVPITSLVFNITEACNLRCTYCHLDHYPKRSNFEVAKAAIDFLIAESRNSRNVFFRFFGGEPLLELSLIEKTVEYGRMKSEQSGKHISFDMISNVTLLETDVINKLKQLGVSIIASIDGTRTTMEKNRPFANRKCTYDQFEIKLSQGIYSRIIKMARMTISPEKTSITDDLQYLVNLGFDQIMLSLANNVAWDFSRIDTLYDEIKEFYITLASKGVVPPLLDTNRLLIRKHAIGRGNYREYIEGFCNAGKSTLGVSEDGDLYPCHRFVQLGKQFALGSVFNGIDKESRKYFLSIGTKSLHPDKCKDCNALKYCKGSCMAFNATGTGNILIPEESYCKGLQKHVDIVEDIYEMLIQQKNKIFIDFLEDSYEREQTSLLRQLLDETEES